MKSFSVSAQFVQRNALLVAMAVALQATARAQELKPLAVVTFSGYDALMSDVDFIGGLAGMPGASQMVEMQLSAMTNNQGLAGLDKAKPIGIVLQLDETQPIPFGGAACLPISDLDALLAVAANMGVNATDMGNGSKQIMVPGSPMPLIAKPSGDWVYLSPFPAILDSLPTDPTALLGDLPAQYDLAVQLNVQNVPEAYRELGIDLMTQGAQQGMQRLPNESDEAFAERQGQMAAQMEEVKRAIREMNNVTLGVKLDEQQGRAFLDIAYTALPDTELAEQLAMNSAPTTNYAGFFQPDAAMMMSFASKTTEADTAQLDQMIETMRNQARTAIDEENDLPTDEARETMKSAVDDFIDALKATLHAGMMDGGAVLNISPNAATFVAGGFIGEPAKVESGLKKIAELAKQEEEFPGVNWNSAQHGNVTFHTMNVPVPEGEAEPRQLFGDTLDLAVGIGEQSVYFALGRNCIDAVKQVIDVSAQNQGKAVPPMEVTFSLTQIMGAASSFADEEEQPKLQMIADMLAREASGNDHVRIIGQTIPNGVRSRIEAEEGVLKAIGMAATLWQQ